MPVVLATNPIGNTRQIHGSWHSRPRVASRARVTRERRRVIHASGARADTPLHVMISGPPAAGKGTQCAKIIEKYGLAHISVGDLLRAEVAAGTPAGRRASECMDAGELVPIDVVVEMVVSKLSEEEVLRRGWLLDGYPRSPAQAVAIDAVGIRPDIFLLVNVPDALLVRRVAGRRLDPVTGEIYHLEYRPPPPEIVSRLQQRSDDTEGAIVTRLATYHSNIRAVVENYSEEVVQVDGDRPMDEVFASICNALDAAQERKHASAQQDAEAQTA